MFGGQTSSLEEPIVKATDENLTSENWQYILDVCDKVDADPENGAREAVAILQKRLAHRSVNVQLYALTLAESLSKNCGSKMHRELASRAFTQTLLRLANDRTTHTSVKSRIIELMDEWSKDYTSDPSLGIMGEAFQQLKSQNPNLQPPSKPQKREITDADRRKEEEELQMALAMSLNEGASLTDPRQESQSAGQETQSQSNAASHTTAATVSRVRALYDFTPSEAGELDFRKGDIISVLDSVYKDWWRGSLKGEVGIFPVNYVETIPDLTPDELRKEAEDELKVFAEAKNIEKLLAWLSDSENSNIADNEQLQNLYHTTVAIRPRLIRLIDKYAQKKDDLVLLNEKFLKARRQYDSLMESSMAQYSRPQPSQQDGRNYLPAQTQPYMTTSNDSAPAYPSHTPSHTPHSDPRVSSAIYAGNRISPQTSGNDRYSPSPFYVVGPDRLPAQQGAPAHPQYPPQHVFDQNSNQTPVFNPATKPSNTTRPTAQMEPQYPQEIASNGRGSFSYYQQDTDAWQERTNAGQRDGSRTQVSSPPIAASQSSGMNPSNIGDYYRRND